ncbi:hypothetical protein ON010_g9018 [Phytophthora cinnamomi]|nr:hypothetical protein ON010_g9018 [Phytophthora cinnamomi]
MSECTTLKYLLFAAERNPTGNCDSVPDLILVELEESQVIEHQEMPSIETPECWQDIFDVLDSEEVTNRTDGCNKESEMREGPLTPSQETEQTVYNGYDEDIPESIQQSFLLPMRRRSRLKQS